MDDFIEPPRPVHVPVRGIGSTVTEYRGKVNWRLTDDFGVAHDNFIDETYYVPKGTIPMRLLPPQVWAQCLISRGFKARWSGADENMTLHWGRNCLDAHHKTVPFSRDNLAICFTAPSFRTFLAYNAIVGHNRAPVENIAALPVHVIPDDDAPVAPLRLDDDEVISAQRRAPPHGLRGQPPPNIVANELPPPEPPPVDQSAALPNEGGGDGNNADGNNATRSTPQVIEFGDEMQPVDEEPVTGNLDAQAELLRWHYRLNHASWLRLKILALLGVIPRRLATVRPPPCAGCNFASLTKTPWRTKAPPNANKIPAVSAPGDCVSVDQLESPVPGLIAQLRGFLTRRRYNCATVFVDQFSDLSFVHLQESTKTEPTLEAKNAFEAYAKQHGVAVKHYHADNGRFAERRFIEAVEQKGQTISFCGANAHHQNGRAEKRIRDLQDKARTMLMHAKARWPRAVSTWLWPYALRTANDIRNTLPLPSTGVAPLEVFAQAEVSPKIRSHHAFGCPVYALDPRAANSRPLPKWDSRSRLGLYLGPSPKHASSVGLVLNIETGLVSPVFHASYDEFFETIRPSAGNPTVKSEWQVKSGFVKPTDPLLASTTRDTTTSLSTPPSAPSGSSDQGSKPVGNGASTTARNDAAPQADGATVVQVEQGTPIPEGDEGAAAPDDVEDPPAQTASSPELRRSSRTRRPTARAAGNPSMERILASPASTSDYGVIDADVEWLSYVEEDFGIAEEMDDPIRFIQCCAANKSDPDTMYVDQALKAPDREQFLDAMKQEVNDHHANKHWSIIPRSGLPEGTRVLPSVWAMKRKRRIATREVYKHKARLNLHGGMMEYGVNYWETYAPVVNWFSIRLFLVVALLFGWHARQVDFTLAYCQAEPECDMYMEIPRGFEVYEDNGELKLRVKSTPDDPRKDRNYALHLLVNLYGGKAAGRIWNQHLVRALREIGFTPSKIDECVFYRGSTIFLLYTDDGIIIDANPSKVDTFIQELTDKGLKLEDQGHITDYLGVKVEATEDGKLKLYQPQLIDDIINQLGFNDRTKSKATPAPSSTIINRDLEGQPFDEEWEYRSVVGKLNFLEKSTRPDITYQTHQVARFSSDPRQSHADAIKHIGRYLVGTKRDGIIIDPKHEQSFETYVDADFSGLWDKDSAGYDPSTARSRSGHIVTFAGVPIVWYSKLQGEFAQSTTESEYISLSEAAKSTICLMNLMDEAIEMGVPLQRKPADVYCKLFEDNSGAYEMATTPKFRPRTKHLNVRYHFFRSYVESGKLRIFPIASDDNASDLMTKPTIKDLFLKFRFQLLGF